MNAHSCPRSWEVEAARDGRLTGDALASLDRHLADCRACLSERRAMEQLSQRLRNAAPSLDSVALRRLRQSTLDRADARIGGRSRRVTLSRSALGVATAVALVALTVRGSWRRSRVVAKSAAPSEILSPSVVVTMPEGDARWARALIDGREQITLLEGTLAIRVRRRPAEPRMVLVVPDGEVEDLGTVFGATVREGHTVELSVSEGAVVFHRKDGGDMRVDAGGSWSSPVTIATTTAATARMLTPAMSPVTSAAPRPTAALGIAPPVGPGKNGSALTPAAPMTSTTSHSTASSAPATGADAEQDALYLQIVALVREGRADEARLAAKDYLRRFPQGFRRAELEALVR